MASFQVSFPPFFSFFFPASVHHSFLSSVSVFSPGAVIHFGAIGCTVSVALPLFSSLWLALCVSFHHSVLFFPLSFDLFRQESPQPFRRWEGWCLGFQDWIRNPRLCSSFPGLDGLTHTPTALPNVFLYQQKVVRGLSPHQLSPQY